MRVHRIYSQVLRMHVDPEMCSYRSISPEEMVDAVRWTEIVAKRPALDIEALLPSGEPKRQAYTLSAPQFPMGVEGRSWEAFGLHSSRAHECDSADFTEYLISQLQDHTRLRRDLRQRYRDSERERSDALARERLTESTDADADSSLASRPVDPVPIIIRNQIVNEVSDYSSEDDDYRSHRYRSRVYRRSNDSAAGDPGIDCQWPGCFGKSQPEDITNERFWIPPGRKQQRQSPVPTVSQNKPDGDSRGGPPQNLSLIDVPYLQWRIYPSAKLEPEQQQQHHHHRGESEPSCSGPREEEEALVSAINRRLGRGASSGGGSYFQEAYSSQYPMTSDHVQRLNDSFGSETPAYLAQFSREAIELVQHFFVPATGQSIEAEMKCWGALYGILKVLFCAILSPPQTVQLLFFFQVAFHA